MNIQFKESKIEGSTLLAKAFCFYGRGYWSVMDGNTVVANGHVRKSSGVLDAAMSNAENYCYALLQNEYGISA